MPQSNRGELFEFDPEIERTLQSVRRALQFEKANNGIFPIDKMEEGYQDPPPLIPPVIPPPPPLMAKYTQPYITGAQ